MKKIFLPGFFFLFLFHLNFLIGRTEQQTEIAYIKVDGFEVPGEWEVQFSRFRSRSWDPEGRKYEPDNNWIRWIKADDNKPNFKRKHIVPSDVYKNINLKDENTILSVRARWDRRDDNWLTLVPSNRRLPKQKIFGVSLKSDTYKFDKLSKENYILLPGKTLDIHCFIWGMGYSYKVEAHLQDYLGKLYIIPGGFLDFYGWRNVNFKIPRYVMQTSKILPRIRPLKFIQFRIVAAENELNTGFYTYFDYLHTKTDIHEDFFFGDRLKRESIYWGDSENEKNHKLK
ncbi:MAG: flagellar filament outer layer protein FlaA [Spirochaetota bacterium]|nr:flagellar filament outer layer protein FlaA [Spirochaetota bacterium]